MIVKRPSHKEISGKLRSARRAVKEGKVRFARPDKVVGELISLNKSAEEVWGLINLLLNEIEPSDYQGKRPPEKSYESSIFDKDLFAFTWDSKLLNKKMYIKFVIHGEYFYYVSLHKSKV